MRQQFNNTQKAALLEVLWDSLKTSKEHKDRKITGVGTKTKDGLLATIERIVYDSESLWTPIVTNETLIAFYDLSDEDWDGMTEKAQSKLKEKYLKLSD